MLIMYHSRCQHLISKLIAPPNSITPKLLTTKHCIVYLTEVVLYSQVVSSLHRLSIPIWILSLYVQELTDSESAEADRDDEGCSGWRGEESL